VTPGAQPRRVAIACQGGGSHTAFTAGVLKGLLREAEPGNYSVVGLSGTSGGAICALLAWHGLVDGDGVRAGQLLDGFWADNSATAPHERLLNAWMMWVSELQDYFVMPAVSPYDNPAATGALDQLRTMLVRWVDFDRTQARTDGEQPLLLVGAVDVLTGDFKTFSSRTEPIPVDAILASAAIPNLFRSVHLGDGVYWDGLFSQNPPVRELIDARPDEIWVIQINPKERDEEPRTITEIADRRNELAGNLSLYQELHFIENIDRMLDEGLLATDGKYRSIVVRVIELSRARLPHRLGAASKLNRDPTFIADLIAHGEQRAEEFLIALAFEDAWTRQDADAVMAFFTDDSEIVCGPPFRALGPYRGRSQIGRFVARHLAQEVTIDLTRKQVARDTVTWTVRFSRGRGTRVDGPAQAVFAGNTVTSLRLGAPSGG
jgi:NTE family protein